MFCPVNVNKTITGIGIVRLQPVEPENARQDEILRRWQRFVRFKWDAAYEDRPGWHGVATFIANAKLAQWCSMAAFFAAEPKAGSRHRITAGDFAAPTQFQFLIVDRNGNMERGFSDPGVGGLKSACRWANRI